MRFKFIGNHPHYDEIVGKSREEYCVLNMAFFFIKHFYDLHGQNKKIEWLDPEIICLKNYHNQMQDLIKESPDLLALSIFIWNEKLQFKIAKNYKEKNPNSIIIMGGPQLTAHKDENFFKKYPFVDYVIFGDGEKAVQKIIDYESGILKTTIEFVNTITYKNQIYKKYSYEQINDHLYLSTSPYLNQKELIKKYIMKLEEHGIGREKIKIAMEFARGCMYTCTFCNWSQMLDTKVKRRSSNWRDELSFFKELDVSIRETDANFGQWKEDLEIFDYANKLYEPTRNFNFIPKHTPRDKKSAGFYIISEVLKKHYDKVFQVFSFQDINDEVLEAIDRPSKTFEQHVIFAKNLKKEVGADISNIILANLMVGLPGQTFDSFCTTVKNIWNTQEFKRFGLSHWEFLPNSPAGDPQYVKKFEVKTIPVMVLGHRLNLYKNNENLIIENLETLYDKVQEKNFLDHYFCESNYVYSTKDMNFIELHACKIFVSELQKYKEKKTNINFILNESLCNTFKKIAFEKSKKIFELSQNILKRYNFLIYARIDHKNNELLPNNLPLCNF